MVTRRLVRFICLAIVVSTRVHAANIAVPSYFEPGALWDRMGDSGPACSLAVLNPDSGPGSSCDPAFAAQVAASRARGLTVLGYVPTGYGLRDRASIETDVDRFYAWYGVDGIFFDEGSTDPALVGLYRSLDAYTKAKGGRAVTVLNPGIEPDERYAGTMDILCIFEDTYRAFAAWTPPAWVFRHDPGRFYILVHSTPPSMVAAAVSRIKACNAGWLYVTPDTLDNPWDSLPDAATWSGELEAVQPLYGWSARNDATTCRYRLHSSGSWTYRRAYIDTDQVAATGLAVGGIGAEFMVSNGWLYRWSGSNWVFVKPVAQTTGARWVEWAVARADLGKTRFPAGASVVFEVARTGGRVHRSPRYRQQFSIATGPVVGYWAENDGSRVYYQATFSGARASRRVFLDTDLSARTGCAVGGIGAEYMICDRALYRWSGAAGWTCVGGADLTVSGSTCTWWIWRSQIKAVRQRGEAAMVVFGGAALGPSLKHEYSE